MGESMKIIDEYNKKYGLEKRSMEESMKIIQEYNKKYGLEKRSIEESNKIMKEFNDRVEKQQRQKADQARRDNFKKVTQSIKTNLQSIQTNLDSLCECYREQYRQMYGHEYEGLLLTSKQIELLNKEGHDVRQLFDKMPDSVTNEVIVNISSGGEDPTAADILLGEDEEDKENECCSKDKVMEPSSEDDGEEETPPIVTNEEVDKEQQSDCSLQEDQKDDGEAKPVENSENHTESEKLKASISSTSVTELPILSLARQQAWDIANGLARYRFFVLLNLVTNNSSSGEESEAMFSALLNGPPPDLNRRDDDQFHPQYGMKQEIGFDSETRPGQIHGFSSGHMCFGSYGLGMESQVQNVNRSNLFRQSSSPAGFLQGFSLPGQMGNYKVKSHQEAGSSRSGLNNHINFSSSPSTNLSFIPIIPETGNGSRGTCNAYDSWNESSLGRLKRNRDGDLKNSFGLVHHLNLQNTASEMTDVEKFLQFEQEITVPCQIRAKRGFVTHPRSIAERVRRTRITDRMKNMQDLFPNIDKQTNQSDMLDLVVEYIKDLQKQVKTINEKPHESKYDRNEKEFRPDFSLPKVMDGLFSLANKLFGVKAEPVNGLAPTWNNDVQFYRVNDSSSSPIAYFYFDPGGFIAMYAYNRTLSNQEQRWYTYQASSTKERVKHGILAWNSPLDPGEFYSRHTTESYLIQETCENWKKILGANWESCYDVEFFMRHILKYMDAIDLSVVRKDLNKLNLLTSYSIRIWDPGGVSFMHCISLEDKAYIRGKECNIPKSVNRLVETRFICLRANS